MVATAHTVPCPHLSTKPQEGDTVPPVWPPTATSARIPATQYHTDMEPDAEYSGDKTDEELLGECDVDTFRSGGPGGQHQNVTDSGVRLRHRPSGIVVTCRQERSQHQNKKTCLRRLRLRLAALEAPTPPRVPTKPSATAVRRRLDEKARRAATKRSRAAPRETDE